MTVYYQNILALIGVFAAFLIVFIIVPSIVMGLKLSVRNFFYNFFASLCISSTVVIFWIYILSYIQYMVLRDNPTSTFRCVTLPYIFFGFVGIILISLRLFYWERTKRHFNAFVEFSYLYIKGVHKKRLLIKRLIKIIISKTIEFARNIIVHPFSFICFILGLGGAAYVRCYHLATEMFYGLPDVYVQTNWASQTINGELFPNGVYPMGMHNIMITIAMLFNINISIVTRVFGGVIGILIVLGLYFLLSRIFKSKAAIGIGFMFYTLSRIIELGAYGRQSYALPQELSMVFLFPTAVFFYEYMKNKKRRDLVFFVTAFALTLSCHFYVTIVAAVLIIAMVIIYSRQIFKTKLFVKMLLSGLLAVTIAITPFMVGLMSGKKWEGSMIWALSVFSSNKEEASSDSEPPPMEDSDTQDNEAVQGEQEEGAAEPVKTRTTLIDRFKKIMTLFGNPPLLLAYIGCCILMLIYGSVFTFIKKYHFYGKAISACGLYSVMLLAIGIMPIFGLPTLIDSGRLYIFFAYNLGFVFAILLEIIMIPLILSKIKALKAVIVVSNFAVLSACCYYLVNVQQKLPLPTYTLQPQYNGAVLTYNKISKDFEKFKWTIVSSVDEVCLTRRDGWHYELCDFIYELSEFRSGDTIIIPSDDVFFFIEKRPISAYRVSYPTVGPPFEPEEHITEEMAAQDIEPYREAIRNGEKLASSIYTDLETRRIIMAKAYYWMEEYKKYFPREISVYYEDDDMIVYRLRQDDPYSLNNLGIIYDYNN